ncbi:Vegetative incompatibility protein HET-E-1 [Ceratobasidium theobromae]|uniref:Vegetative incompatibility protein HET-E-1 n=1 Tax=Ceratobasidium theobromae TaxID=1582974 RepID=A0A5N5QEU8_9AGAM|nr:Vegetative incompatibility protein HET-E-1 [Ceratobasidium theobromae]
MVLGPLHTHTEPIHSVSFSTNGAFIASSSTDKTICIWDARSGEVARSPIKGHTNSVSSVGFSPDDARIVSGSNDKTIRVWSVRSGDIVFAPLQGHTRSVLSVEFSPDSTRIVSGSVDSTICVWDASNGDMIFGPLKQHTDSVTSVAFSNDCTRIVSGSLDSTICVWNAQSGEMVFRLLGHRRSVRSVGFSRNGTRIISGSADGTLRLWSADVCAGGKLLDLLQGHTNPVMSVEFSPDCTRAVSSSADGTILMWDLRDMQSDANVPPSSADYRAPTKWTLNKDGWVVDDQSRPLIWVPLDLRGALGLISVTHGLGSRGQPAIFLRNFLYLFDSFAFLSVCIGRLFNLPLTNTLANSTQLYSHLASLFRRLLRVHRALPVEMRLLGDVYVKAEFRRHQKIDNPIHIIGFLSQWKMYLDQLEEQANSGGIERFKGRRLDPTVFEKMSAEQIGQLYELMHATKEVWKPVKTLESEADTDPEATKKS